MINWQNTEYEWKQSKFIKVLLASFYVINIKLTDKQGIGTDKILKVMNKIKD